MKKVKDILMVGLMALLLASCTEDIVIDVEDGDRWIGVEAYFSDELKHHETILSYTSNFYDHDEITMVTGAMVYVTDGVDTIVYHEDAENHGHYFTDIVAAKRNTLYKLYIEAPDINGELVQLYSESFVCDNVDHIDSLVIKHPFVKYDHDSLGNLISVFDTNHYCVYPYFQMIDDPNVVFMPLVSKNDTLQNDSLNQQLIIPVGGYAGFYINGPEMQLANIEIPVYIFRKEALNQGDRIRMNLESINPDYVSFFYSVFMSTGSNPMLGAPANVSTNIQPEGLAVGWFMTASVVSAETVFDNRY